MYLFIGFCIYLLIEQNARGKKTTKLPFKLKINMDNNERNDEKMYTTKTTMMMRCVYTDEQMMHGTTN